MRRKATSASQLRANQDKSVTKSDEDTDETPPRTSEDTLSGAFPRLPSSQVSIRSAVSLHQVNEVDEQIDKSLARVGEEGKEVVRIGMSMDVT